MAFAVGEIALRRALLPSIGLVLEEPKAEGRATGDLWPALVAAVVAALLAALPLMLGWGEGAELRHPLGLAIFGGLIATCASAQAPPRHRWQ